MRHALQSGTGGGPRTRIRSSSACDSPYNCIACASAASHRAWAPGPCSKAGCHRITLSRINCLCYRYLLRSVGPQDWRFRFAPYRYRDFHHSQVRCSPVSNRVFGVHFRTSLARSIARTDRNVHCPALLPSNLQLGVQQIFDRADDFQQASSATAPGIEYARATLDRPWRLPTHR
jgi:hypothetical protein